MFDFINPQFIINTLGIAGIIGIVFAESGLFFGFFLPGDSLLFTAGFLASQNILGIKTLLIGTFIAAVLGDALGFYFGKKVGPSILKKEQLKKTEDFYAKYGKKTIILARFVPVIRTFAPIVAGIGNMEYKTFFFFNVIGAFLWTFGITLLGYFLGKTVPGAEEYILPIVATIIIVSFLPGIAHFISKKKV